MLVSFSNVKILLALCCYPFRLFTALFFLFFLFYLSDLIFYFWRGRVVNSEMKFFARRHPNFLFSPVSSALPRFTESSPLPSNMFSCMPTTRVLVANSLFLEFSSASRKRWTEEKERSDSTTLRVIRERHASDSLPTSFSRLCCYSSSFVNELKCKESRICTRPRFRTS